MAVSVDGPRGLRAPGGLVATGLPPGAQGRVRLATALGLSVRLASGSSLLPGYLEAGGGPGLPQDTLRHLPRALSHSEHVSPVLRPARARKEVAAEMSALRRIPLSALAGRRCASPARGGRGRKSRPARGRVPGRRKAAGRV